jgi:hypothetical protein
VLAAFLSPMSKHRQNRLKNFNYTVQLEFEGQMSKPTPMPRKQLQDLAKLRLREAEALYVAGFYDGSVYLAGYAVELGLKARICRLLHVADYPLDIGQAFNGVLTWLSKRW